MCWVLRLSDCILLNLGWKSAHFCIKVYTADFGKVTGWGLYMKVVLRALQNDEETSVFEMFKDIPKTENGFGNKLNGTSRVEFNQIVEDLIQKSHSTDIKDGKVPQTYYVLFIDDIPVGFSKLRHCLTSELLKRGGHIGYGLSPKYRGRGYAKILLSETLKKAKELGIEKVLITCDIENAPSYKTIEGCRGILENIEDGKRRYWICL